MNDTLTDYYNNETNMSISEIAAEWDINVNARVYELENHLDATYFDTLIPNIKKKLNDFVSKPSRIIDLGCGLGYLTDKIRKWGYDVIGIDISVKSIEFAKLKFPHTEFVISSINQVSQNYGNEYDACILNMVLHNVPDLKQNLEAIRRILKPGGHVIATIPNPEIWFSKFTNDSIEPLGKNCYKVPFKIRDCEKHPSNITYFHRKLDLYNSYISSKGFKIIGSYTPISREGEIQNDLTLCVWKKK